MCAKDYENLTMLSKFTAKNVGDVFFETHCMLKLDHYSTLYETQTKVDCLD